MDYYVELGEGEKEPLGKQETTRYLYYYLVNTEGLKLMKGGGKRIKNRKKGC